jgi:hypothetical protein
MRLMVAVHFAGELWGLAQWVMQKPTRVWEMGRVPCRKNIMKQLFLFALSFATFGDSLFAQDTLITVEKPMIVRIVTIDRQIRHGYLYAITDSSLLFSAERLFPRPMDSLAHRGLHSFGYREMGEVDIYRKGAIGRSMLLGLGIGVATGALLGVIGGDDPPNELIAFSAGEKAAVFGLTGGTIGVVIGLIAGVAGHHTFHVGGDRKKYERLRRKTIARL